MITSLRWEFEFVCMFRLLLFDRAVIYQCPIFFLYNLEFLHWYTTHSGLERLINQGNTHISRETFISLCWNNIPLPLRPCVCVCSWVSVFRQFLSNFCQRTGPIFTSRTDAYFPVFLPPTLSQSFLPVFIHKLCPAAGFILLCLSKSPLISLPTGQLRSI